MLGQIPVERAITYFILLGIVPIALVFVYLISEKNQLDELGSTIELIEEAVLMKDHKQSSNLAIRQLFKDADHFYIDKHLETLVFLDNEIEMLQKLSEDPNFAIDDKIKRRLEFLTGASNNMSFSEGVVHSFPFFQETMETQTHPVEINSVDLKRILARIEGVSIGPHHPGPNRPQLMITEFKLDKKEVMDNHEIFQLHLNVLKREFL